MENLKSDFLKYHSPDSLLKQWSRKALSIPQKDLWKPKNPNLYSTIKSSVNWLKNNNVSSFHNTKPLQSKHQSPNLKKLLTKAEFGEGSLGPFNCIDKKCACNNFLLINHH